MKKLFSLFNVFIIGNLFSQNPTPLFFDININKVLTVQDGSVRLAYSQVDQAFYYLTLNGDIYKIKNIGSTYSDSLIATTADHGIQSTEGFLIQDSVMFVSGNNDKDSTYTKGFLMKGVLQLNNTWIWSVVAQTVPYLTTGGGPFDHWISGLGINKSGDTLLLCSGSRGDHGEINDVNGQFPGKRNLALTSVIFQIPVNGNNILIPDDSTLLNSQNLIFARGIRNTFDFAYNAAGDIFGAENSGDRDMEDELNWLQHGHHYGFPWMMGSQENPQQYPWFNPSADLMINHNSAAWIRGTFTNDTLFPQKPAGLITDLPCKNTGNDAAFLRDSITGLTYNAAAVNQDVYSFTPHRSPLGLVFDTDSVLGNMYHGNGFVLSYTRGDSTISGFSKLLAPFNDPSEDLIMLQMIKDNVNQTYSFQSTKIVSNFKKPIDAVQLDTSIYILETGYGGSASLWRVDFPRKLNTGIAENNSDKVNVFPNPASDNLTVVLNYKASAQSEIAIKDISGRIIKQFNSQFQSEISVPLNSLNAGTYMLEINSSGSIIRKSFIKM